MRRETVLMIWVGGAVLAALLYAIGPDRFLDACLNLFDTIDAAFRHLAFILGAQAFSVIRALAIAFYLVFAVLSVLSSQRGTGGFGGLVVMTFIAALLVWRPYSTDPAPISHWLVTLALVLVGAATMTQRLVGPARRPVPPPPPFPPGRAP